MTLARALLPVTIAFAAFPGAIAHASWSDPVAIFGQADGQSWLGTLSDGSVVAIAMDHHRGPVQAAVRPPGAAFGKPVPISPPNSSGAWGRAEIITGPHGRALFSTTLRDEGGQQKFDLRDPDGSWRAIDPPAELCCPGFLAIDAAGRLIGFDYNVETGQYDLITVDQSGGVTRRQYAPASYNPAASSVVLAPDGTIFIGWYGRNANDSADGHMYLSSAAPGDDFGPPEMIASGKFGESTPLTLGRGRDGTLIAVFGGAPRYVDGRNGNLYTSVRPPGGSWSRPARIPGDPVTNLDMFDFAMNRAGDAVLAWHGGTNADGRLVMSYRPAGGDWERATVGPPQSGSIPLTGIGGDGAALAADTCYTECDPDRFVSYDHLDEGGFAAPEDIAPFPQGSDATTGMELAVDRLGDAVAVWNWDRHGVFASVHRVGKATGGGTPAVDDFEIGSGTTGSTKLSAASKRPRLFSYRLSRRARVLIRIDRVPKHGKRVRVAKLRAALYRGSNASPIPPDVSRRLRPGRRYRATIVAVGRNGRRSKPRSIIFTR
jgi:hypothetical protein